MNIDNLPLINPDWRFANRLNSMEERLHYMFRRRGLERWEVSNSSYFSLSPTNTWEYGPTTLRIEVYPPPNRFLALYFKVEQRSSHETVPTYTRVASNLPTWHDLIPPAASAENQTGPGGTIEGPGRTQWQVQGPMAEDDFSWHMALFPNVGWITILPPQQLCIFEMQHLCNSVTGGTYSEFKNRILGVMIL